MPAPTPMKAPSTAEACAGPRVVLVSMPWTALIEPPLGLATLQGHMDAAAIPSSVYHASLDLLRYVSQRTYDFVAGSLGINEFLFTAVFEATPDAEQRRMLTRLCEAYAEQKRSEQYASAVDLMQLFMTLRNGVIPGYLATCAERIIAMKPTMVGFTCMFDQTIASAALATLLKEVDPDLLVVLGGYAVQHESGAEILKAFAAVDCIAQGDGEPMIEALARASVGEGSLRDIKGVLTREGGVAGGQWDLRGSATPSFRDWFADLDRLAREDHVRVPALRLPIESSRGCWWGQKHHCTFCGIDEVTLRYRAKAPEQVLRDIATLRERHGEHIAFRFSDYIWPVAFYRDLLPTMADMRPRLRLEAEVKANVARDTLTAFAQAGFAGLQPGIESFSTPILLKMRKGVRAIQNVKLLKWGALESIEIQYNLLTGFPGDDAEDYRRLLRQLPALYHLIPPFNSGAVAITRFAPLQTEPEKFGYDQPLQAHANYNVLFSADFLQTTGFDMKNYCYFFENYITHSPELTQLYSQIALQTEHWKRQHREAQIRLSYERVDGGYAFCDTRFGHEDRYAVSGLAADLYGLCDIDSISLDQAAARLDCGADALADAVGELEERRLLWVSDDQIFGLAVPDAIAADHARRNWKACWHSLHG